MAKIIVPDKLNVAFQERRQGYNYWEDKDEYEKFLLGFATYYKQNGELNVETHKTWGSKDIPLKDYSNDAVEGFEVAGSVSRWSTSNKWVEINDPRGFRLQISVANLMVLLDNSIMDHGKFIGKMAWGWDSGKLILLSEDSDLYLEGRANFKYEGSPNIPPKSVGLGSTVVLGNGAQMIYYGHWYHVNHLLNDAGKPSFTSGCYNRHEDKMEYTDTGEEKSYIFKDTRTGLFRYLKSPAFKAIVKPESWTKEETYAKLKEFLVATSSASIAVFLTNQKIKDVCKILGLHGKHTDDYRYNWVPDKLGLSYHDQHTVREIINQAISEDFGKTKGSYSWDSKLVDPEDQLMHRHSQKVGFNPIMVSEKKIKIEDWLAWVLENVKEVYRGDITIDGTFKRYYNEGDLDRDYMPLIKDKVDELKEAERVRLESYNKRRY